MRKATVTLLVVAIGAISLSACKNSKKTTESKEVSQKSETKPKPKNEYDGAVAQIAVTKPAEDPKTTTKATESTKPPRDEQEREVPAPEYPDSLFLRLERTPCFGNCPVYVVNVYSSGFAHMVGKKFFDYEGEYTTRFTEEELMQMEKLAVKYGYASLDHVYDAPVTDLPSTTTIIQSENLEHWVYNRMNGPQELRAFETEIETMIKDKQWSPFSKK